MWGDGGEAEADVWGVVVASLRVEEMVIQGGGLVCFFGGRAVRID